MKFLPLYYSWNFHNVQLSVLQQCITQKLVVKSDAKCCLPIYFFSEVARSSIIVLFWIRKPYFPSTIDEFVCVFIICQFGLLILVINITLLIYLLFLLFCTQELYHELHALDRFEHDYRLKQKEQDGLSSRGQFHQLQMRK